YDQSGDGTMLGEGIGVLVLKRLADAKRDGDHIYAVIRSVGSSSDGKGAAIFAPTPDGQMRALTNAYENAGITPESIELVEGHGTGTAVGDAVEVEALARVFAAGAPQSSRTPWCALGSVKSQIGHTKAAAGSAGLIKSILAIYNKTLPPTVKVERPLPILNAPDSPFYIAASARPWISAGPRRAGVSAFGFGGSNFHCVVEEAEGVAKTAVAPADLILLALSGTSRESLAAQLATAACADDLEKAAAESRSNFSVRAPFRLLIAGLKDQLAAIVEQSLECLSRPGPKAAVFPTGAFYSDEPPTSGPLGFLLPGPNSVRQNMFKDLTADRPELIDALSLAAKNLAAEAPELPPLGLVLYPPELASPEAAQKWSAALADPRLRRASAGAVTEGLVKILEKFGLKPAAILGGEPADLSREMNRDDARTINLWLEVGPGCEMSLAALAAFGDTRRVLTLDQGEDGHIDLAFFLARLAVWGVPVNLAAWPDVSSAANEAKADGFTVPVSGANRFNKKQIPPSPPKAAAAPMAAASTGDGRGLAAALEAMTAESARLHQAFLDQQSQAMDLIRQSLGGNSPAAAAPAPAPAPAPFAPISSRPAPLSDGGPSTAPDNDAISAAVLQVVGAETGYPVEMLNLSMDLEADLGLDSIKKVEIMAVLSEKFPEMQGLGAESMSRASTLGDLVALVGPAAFAETPAPALFTAPPDAAPVDQSGGVWPILREVVSAETGYPQEMLRPEMSLSDDLGLDSIKMVEIASLMNERLPSAQA
ncbi:phosphopantetheine-binding protein, partial [Deltaproteobacteria bacterium OttesenSCG-928-K17]|nr:phosphopantetheine-binding protein [Deltaproteobacteria bacterium OttesenSCG-928-K17]